MKASEIRKRDDAGLVELLRELLREQFNLRMQKGTGQLTRPSRLREVRRDIARVHTVINERRRNAA